MNINLDLGIFSWQLEKLQILNNAPQWTNKDKQVHTILVRWLFISSTPTHNLELMKIVGGHGSNSQTGQVIFGSMDHDWFFAKTAKTLFKSAQPVLVHSIFQRNLLVFLSTVWCYCSETDLWIDLHFELQPPSSLLGYNTLLPPPLSHYSLPKPKVPYPTPRCAYRLKLLVWNSILGPWWNTPKKS